MGNRRRLFAGRQLRELRARRGLRQADLARQLAISAPYLSQLEHDDRPLTPMLAEKLATLFPLDWQDFALDETERLAFALREAANAPLFEERIEADALDRLAEQQPAFARRFVELYDNYRRACQRIEMVDEAISVDAVGRPRLPWEEIRDWFHLQNNYVDSLDKAAEQLAARLWDEDQYLSGAAMRRHLREEHATRVMLEPGAKIREFDRQTNTLRIDSRQPQAGIRFQMACHIAMMTLGDKIEDVTRQADLQSAAARELLKLGLANYAAGAILMPYEHFRNSARRYRHDIDRLALAYRTSFEQTCHRLSTLQRQHSRGLPVFFCRVDMAGNITKRHSATRLQFARYGGACPLWIVHEAAAIPDRIQVQLLETPDGVQYVCMAKGLVKPSGKYDRNPRRYAVALGCEAKDADAFIYADTLIAGDGNLATPIGSSCRTCPRMNCEQRAYPPSGQELHVDLLERSTVPYKLGPAA